MVVSHQLGHMWHYIYNFKHFVTIFTLSNVAILEYVFWHSIAHLCQIMAYYCSLKWPVLSDRMRASVFFPPLHLNFQIIGFDFWLHVYGSFHVINLAHSVERKNIDCKWQASQSARQACQYPSSTNDFPLVYFLSHWPFPSKTKLLI